jgi:hypothetical protein
MNGKEFYLYQLLLLLMNLSYRWIRQDRIKW